MTLFTPAVLWEPNGWVNIDLSHVPMLNIQ